MGQKVNPHGLRVGVIKDWDSRWFANKADFGDTLVEDFNVRKFIKKNLYAAGVPKIEIERFADKVRIHIHCAKPGIVIGRGGAEIEKLRTQLEKMMGKQVYVNIVEVKQPDMDAQLVAEKIALDLENRISFRRAMKQAIGRAMRLGAKGIKTKVSGRLGGAEIHNAAALAGASYGNIVDAVTPHLPYFPTEQEVSINDNDLRCAELAERLGFDDCRAMFTACQAL